MSRATGKVNGRWSSYIEGVLFDYTQPERLRLIGTDGRRLHATFTRTLMHSADEIARLVRTEWIEAFKRLNLPADTDVFLEFRCENILAWRIPSAGIHGVAKCIDTPYPDYDKVIPESCESRFRVDLAATLESLDALTPVATQQDGRDMVIVNANSVLTLSAESESMGSAKAEVSCEHIAGPESNFALNIIYFGETLKLADGEILMSNSSKLEPAVFEFPGTERVAVVMPVRLPE